MQPYLNHWPILAIKLNTYSERSGIFAIFRRIKKVMGHLIRKKGHRLHLSRSKIGVLNNCVLQWLLDVASMLCYCCQIFTVCSQHIMFSNAFVPFYRTLFYENTIFACDAATHHNFKDRQPLKSVMS